MATFTTLHRRMPALLASGISIELKSAPGRGKSEFIQAQPERMSKLTGKPWGFATMFLATMTPSDLMGYMVPATHTDGRLVSKFTIPPWAITEDGRVSDEFENGILFLDEFGQGEADVKRASAELLLNKRIGGYRLKPGWSVIAASNRDKDRSGVTKSFDFVINRRMEINITDDIRSWEDWAFAHGVSPIAIAFAAQNPQIVFADGVPTEQGPWCTPRSLVMCDNVLKAMATGDGKYPQDPDAVEFAAGLIGQGAAAQMFAFIRLDHEMPRYEDIIRSPKTVKVPEAPDAQMLVCHTLASRVGLDDIEPVIKYVERLPKEFSVTFIRAAARRAPEIGDSDAVGFWCQGNSRLMAAVSKLD
jgi:hypothetical protein